MRRTTEQRRARSRKTGAQAPPGTRATETKKLTPARVLFAHEVASGATQAAALRVAYPHASRWSAHAVAVQASRLARQPDVLLTIEQVRAEARAATAMSLGEHLAALLELREAARAAGLLSAAVAAEVARGKAAGFHGRRASLTVAPAALDWASLLGMPSGAPEAS